jgi:hypothetical protein
VTESAADERGVAQPPSRALIALIATVAVLGVIPGVALLGPLVPGALAGAAPTGRRRGRSAGRQFMAIVARRRPPGGDG